ncbi:Coatomer beta subunit, appendage platform domain [Dillenia turbinata]|uniref:Coatomer beta subunit, appendage platform domain n=1 Tax=Dillenia turbinata TaxID=194707 RepID=A0AAN8UIK7_9MAGN
MHADYAHFEVGRSSAYKKLNKQFRETEEIKAKAQVSHAQPDDLIDFYCLKSRKRIDDPGLLTIVNPGYVFVVITMIVETHAISMQIVMIIALQMQDSGDWFSCNSYNLDWHWKGCVVSLLPTFMQSVLGEDALVNVSIEKEADGKLSGYIRISSKTQGTALNLGDKITLKQKGGTGFEPMLLSAFCVHLSAILH